MYAEPPNFDRELLADTLRSRWEISVSSLRYEPVGFGTHHYIGFDTSGSTWFVNVDDVNTKAWIANDPAQTLDALDRAFRTAVVLRDVGLGFVHAPTETPDGSVVNVIDERYAVSVFEYVEGRSNDFGTFASDEERRMVLGALGRMHAASGAVPRDLPRKDSLEVSLRAELFDAMLDLSAPWTGGPYSDRTRELLAGAADGVRAMFDRYDALVPAVRAGMDGWVVTHGEPHGSNIIVTPDERLLVIDWDTAAIGPRERDLWMVEPRNEADWDAYIASGGTADLDPRAIELYNLWWSLSEITGYVDTFRSPHTDDANTRTAWKGLLEYLPT